MTAREFAMMLRHREEISIRVTGRQSGKTITLPVWFVLEDGTLWLLPVHGSKTQWYRNVRANRRMIVRAGRARLEVQPRPTESARTVQSVVRKFRTKYTPGEIARYYDRLDAAVEIDLAPARRAATRAPRPS
jgi:deazaflavin-dependent oxidoreductase (nitroreductase family)